MQILKIISLLMNYPNENVKEAASDLVTTIRAAKEISPDMRERLINLVNEIYGQDLMDAQETYVGLFDRGRQLSLLLFEHVHGESRDRGQAMVDLMAQYEQAGYEIAVKELPDYIPLYLEYLAQGEDMAAREGLGDVAHILGRLSARLQERGCSYHCLFDALLMISGVGISMKEVRDEVRDEERDDTPEALDKIWEEEAVTFGPDDAGAGACPSQRPAATFSENGETPVRWIDADALARSKQESRESQVGG